MQIPLTADAAPTKDKDWEEHPRRHWQGVGKGCEEELYSKWEGREKREQTMSTQLNQMYTLCSEVYVTSQT